MSLKRNVSVLLCISMMFFLSQHVALANSYNYSLAYIDSQLEWSAPYIQLKSPARSATVPSTNIFPGVNSKNNQPRSVGSRPHQGTDLAMTETTKVYALYGGTVSDKQSWKFSLSIFLNTHASYLHITPVSTLAVNDAVAIDDQIGTIASTANNGGYRVHLHFGLTDVKISSTTPEPLYITTGARYDSYSQWNYGLDLDTLGNSLYNTTTNVLTIASYTLNDTRLQEHSSVEFRYRAGSATTWSVASMSKATYKTDPITGTSQATHWSIDLDNLSLSSGTSVQWYVVGYRNIDSPSYDTYCEVGEASNAAGACDTTEAHNWAIFPAKYQHPNVTSFPTATPAKYETLTV